MRAFEDRVLSVAFSVSGLAGIVSYRLGSVNGKTELAGRWTAVTANGQVMQETCLRR